MVTVFGRRLVYSGSLPVDESSIIVDDSRVKGSVHRRLSTLFKGRPQADTFGQSTVKIHKLPQA